MAFFLCFFVLLGGGGFSFLSLGGGVVGGLGYNSFFVVLVHYFYFLSFFLQVCFSCFVSFFLSDFESTISFGLGEDLNRRVGVVYKGRLFLVSCMQNGGVYLAITRRIYGNI